jgi:hypothetical protein
VLYRAAAAGDLTVIRLLIRHGADVNKKLRVVSPVTRHVTRDAVALHAALWAKEARILLRAGADPNAQNYRGVSALMTAATSCKFETVDALLKHGALATLVDRGHRTAADHVRLRIEWLQSAPVKPTARKKRLAELRRMLTVLSDARVVAPRRRGRGLRSSTSVRSRSHNAFGKK